MTTPILIVAGIKAEHPAAQEFNSELQKLAARRKGVVSDLISQSKAELSKLKLQYHYHVVEATREPFLPESVKASDPVRVVRTWVNKLAFMELAVLFGVAAPEVPEQIVSHVYYRIGNVMVKAEGHGRDVLNVNVPVTDQEWNELKAGRPADKFIVKRAA